MISNTTAGIAIRTAFCPSKAACQRCCGASAHLSAPAFPFSSCHSAFLWKLRLLSLFKNCSNFMFIIQNVICALQWYFFAIVVIFIDYLPPLLCICTNCTNFNVKSHVSPQRKSVKLTKAYLKQMISNSKRSTTTIRNGWPVMKYWMIVLKKGQSMYKNLMKWKNCFSCSTFRRKCLSNILVLPP